MLETFGKRLRQAREAKRMSIKMLSQKSGVSVSMIYSNEKGEVHPNLYTAVAVADVLGVSLDWLAGRESDGRNV